MTLYPENPPLPKDIHEKILRIHKELENGSAHLYIFVYYWGKVKNKI